MPQMKWQLRRLKDFAVNLQNYAFERWRHLATTTRMQAVVFSIFSFVKNRSCVTQICITKIQRNAFWYVVVVKWRHHANILSSHSCNYLIRRQEAHPISHLPGNLHELLWRQVGLWFNIRVLVVSVVESPALPQVTQQVSIRDILNDYHERL